LDDPKQDEDKASKKRLPDMPAGSVAGVVALVLGAVATVLTAVTDWGSDSSGLAAARRNHTSALEWAAGFAIAALVIGAIYTIVRQKQRRWSDALLGIGVMAVGIGLGFGIISTTERKPGRPIVNVERVDASSIRVVVRGEGLPSDASFVMRVDAYDNPGNWLADLMLARFSPNQKGELRWSQRVRLPPSWINHKRGKNGKVGRAFVGRVQVNVDRDDDALENTEGTAGNDASQNTETIPSTDRSNNTQRTTPRPCNTPAPTCVYLLVPRRPERKATAPATAEK
jgi:hypothetical protein